MEIRFLGAVGTVTGSCTWLRDQTRGWSFLVDCGVQQDRGAGAHWSAAGAWPFNPADIQFIALTHAHLDHSGLIPELCRRGFRGPVYCTHETAEIAKIVLKDNSRHPDAMYSERDVESINWKPFREDVPFDHVRPVAADLFLAPYMAGHIVGAVSLGVLWGVPREGQRSIIFSGDLGPGAEDAEVLPMIRFPWQPRPFNFAVVESTYGNVVREDSAKSPVLRLKRLAQLMERIVQTNGTLLLPAFSIGRVQALLYEIHAVVASDPETFKALKLVLDAHMAERVNTVAARAYGKSVVSCNGKVRQRWLGKQVFRQLGLDESDPDDIDAALAIVRMTLVDRRGKPDKHVTRGNELAHNWRPLVQTCRDLDLTRDAQPQGPAVVLCSGADGSVGASPDWIRSLATSPRNVIASTGYTAPSSVMSQLAKFGALDPKERRRHTGSIELSRGEPLKIRDISADVVSLHGYSAHADQQDVANWLFYRYKDEDVMVAPTVFIQHGCDTQRHALAKALTKRAGIMQRNLNVIMPTPSERMEWRSLDGGGSTTARSGLSLVRVR